MAKQCSHPDCSYPVFSKGLCQNHWRQSKAVLVASSNSNKAVQRTQPINKVSDKQAKLNAAYNVLAVQFKKNHPVCQARIKCIGSPVTDVHHKRGRGQYLLDETTYLAVCRPCHDWIGQNHAQALVLGLSESRLDNHTDE